jgi:hypothetical protein
VSLASRISDFATAVGTALKSTRTLVNGNAADLSALNTTDKTNLVAAINEVLAGGGGGVGATIQEATITLPGQALEHQETIVFGCVPTQSCRVWLAPTDDTEDNTIEMLEGYNIDGVCGTDEITFYWRSHYYEEGPIKLNYEVI